jgi:hypothetical protein
MKPKAVNRSPLILPIADYQVIVYSIYNSGRAWLNKDRGEGFAGQSVSKDDG